MSGAQYRWPEAITPWTEYRNTKIVSISEILHFGGTANYCKERAEASGEYLNLIHQVDADFAQAMDRIVDAWQQMNVRLGAMLKWPEDRFQSKRKSLLDYVEIMLMKFNITSQWSA